MKRRDFITLLSSAVATWPLSGHAQQAAARLIGYLSSTGEAADAVVVAAIRQGLNERGFGDEKEVLFAYRWSEGDYSKLPQLATDLVDRKVNVIVASGLPAALAAKARNLHNPNRLQTCHRSSCFRPGPKLRSPGRQYHGRHDAIRSPDA